MNACGIPHSKVSAANAKLIKRLPFIGPLLLANISRAIVIRFGDTCRKAGFDCTGCRTAAPSLTEGHGRTPGLRRDLRAMCKRHYLGTNLAQQAATLNDLQRHLAMLDS